jgi:hypothetical protein
MTPLFKKLNFKDQKAIYIINAPKSLDDELEVMKQFTAIHKALDDKEINFIMVFATKQEEIDNSISVIYPKLEGDAILWYCYPKGTSKKYTCEFNRDNGWKAIGKYNLEPVRQIAIDEDWSALRFRKTDYIKKLTRSNSFALSAEGKRRTAR